VEIIDMHNIIIIRISGNLEEVHPKIRW